MNIKKSLVLAAAVATAVAAPGAFATNGYMSHGNGINAKAMGGVGIAFPQDAMAAATNPAGQALIGNRMSFGIDWFRPFRSVNRITSGTNTSYTDNVTNDFYVPEFGYATPFGSGSSLGVVIYGAGLGTDFGTPWAAAGGTTNLYSMLKQMYIAPTWAMKMGNHAFGVSLNIVKGSFDVRGLQGFAGFTRSNSTANLTDKGEDGSSGVGLKLGWMGELTPNLSMGATWQLKTNMSKFGKYKELFAEQGDFDVPEQYGLGMAYKATPATTVGVDVVKIKYSGVKSLANRYDANPSAGAGYYLGDNNGIGFGWKDQTVYKLGVSHQIGKWTLRAGYNYAKAPIQADQTLFNTIAPAVTTTHYTVGASWAVSSSTDVALAFMYSPSNELKGSGNAPNGMTNPDLKMNQNSLGISLNVKM